MALPREQMAELSLLSRWQNRLMPWMIILPTVLIATFIYLSTTQLNEFKVSINDYRNSSTADNLLSPWDTTRRDNPFRGNLEYVKLYSRVKMEEKALNNRYAQGGFLLMARTYSKYLGFFTGMILAMVAAVFIISKLKEDISHLEGSIQEKMKFRVVSSSPGVIFGVLGTALMLSTILYNPAIAQTDSPLYLVPEISIPATLNSTALPAPPQGQITPEQLRRLGLSRTDTTSKSGRQ